jgi:predicted SnoaL-like aldol condensation-catalyzing enzyme
MTDLKSRAVSLLKSLGTGDAEALAHIDADNYVEHAINVGFVVTGLPELFRLVPRATTRVHALRVFQEGAFVFAHSEYELFGPKVGFNVFRFKGDRIVEHWSNLEDRPAGRNPSGHTMTDGPMLPTELTKTESNKTLVRAFVHDVLVNGRMDKLAGYFHGDSYTQHNPNIGDGLSGLGAALEQLAKRGVVMKYDRIHRVLGEGSFVLVMSEGSIAGRPTSFFDLFRIERGRLAEHWDTIEPIGQGKNSNGKF